MPRPSQSLCKVEKLIPFLRPCSNWYAKLGDIPTFLQSCRSVMLFSSQSCFNPVSYTHLDVYKRQVNRLDKGTSGLMVIAKNGFMHTKLIELLHTDSFVREYLAICEGMPSPSRGEIMLNIRRDPKSMIKRIICADGAPSHTGYEVLVCENNLSLVKLHAYTGRTHQLRLHMKEIGNPLLGDWLYGNENKMLIDRPALHSSRICLIHPVSGKTIDVYAPLPDEMCIRDRYY